MPSTLQRAGLRHFARHPWQLGLAVLGITLGVAVFVAVQLAQRSASAALELSSRAVLGRATDRVQGDSHGFDESLYRDLALAFPTLAMVPVIEQTVVLANQPKLRLRLLGIDPVSQLAAAGEASNPRLDAMELMRTPGLTAIAARTASRLGLVDGARLAIRAGAQQAELQVRIVPPATDGDEALPEDMLVVDIATAQEVLNTAGVLSYLDLYLEPDQRQATVQALRASLPTGVELIDTGRELQANRGLTRAFNTNLTALSALALLVGMFLIYNTETFLVVQRMSLFGCLRTLGVTRGQLLVMLLTEGLLLGSLGGVLGIFLGEALARALLGLVSRTINDLYFNVAVTTVVSSPGILALGLAAGILATVVAALVPAWEATRAPVTSNLRRDAAHVRHGPRRNWAGIAGSLLLLLALVLALLPVRALWLGFCILLLFMIGAASLMPPVMTGIGGLSERCLGGAGFIPERLGIRTVLVERRRTSIAAAALMIAAAASIGISIMITSFRSSVADWLQHLLRADVYLANDVTANGPVAAPDLSALRESLLRTPGIIAVSGVKRRNIESDCGTLRLTVYELPAAAHSAFEFRAGDASRFWQDWEGTDIVMVTEPFAYHQHVEAGDKLMLETESGPREFTIGAIYADYATERGNVAMSRVTYSRHWRDQGYDGLGVYGDNGLDDTALLTRVRATLPADSLITVQSNRALRRQSLKVFDRTFAVTQVMRSLALIVAMVGVISALLAQQLEHLRDYGLLRALGFSPAELQRTIFAQTGLLGVAAATFAVPVGIGLALVLIRVVNLRSFGWTMSVSIPLQPLLESWLLVVATALLAGIYPALRVLRIPPAQAMRDE